MNELGELQTLSDGTDVAYTQEGNTFHMTFMAGATRFSVAMSRDEYLTHRHMTAVLLSGNPWLLRDVATA